MTFSGTDQRVFQYSPTAIFSAVGISIYRGYIVVVHRGDWNESPYTQFLDFYRIKDGQYVASVEMPYMAGDVGINGTYLYALHRIDEEVYLVIYENNLKELIKDALTAYIDE